GADHPRALVAQLDLARVQIARGRGAATEPVLRRVLTTRLRLLREGDWRIAQAKSLLAASLLAQGREREAEPLMLDAAAGLKSMPGTQGRECDANRARLVTLYTNTGRPDQAAIYRGQD